MLAATAAGTAASLVAGCSALGGGNDSTVAMTDDLAFDPERLTVDAGTTVTWTNDGSVPHTVTAFEDRIPNDAAYFASGGFESEQAARNGMSGGLVEEDESYEHTFETTGTHRYFCIPHEGSGMTGTVVVE